MKILERILFFGVLFSIIYKINRMPGSTIVFLFFNVLLSSFYFYLGFAFFNKIRLRKIFKKESYQGLKAMNYLAAIFTGGSLSLAIAGMMYMAQDWPGYKIMVNMGFLALFGMLFLLMADKLFLKKGFTNLGITSRVLTFSAIGVFLMSIPYSSFVNWQYGHYQPYADVLLELDKDPDNIDLQT